MWIRNTGIWEQFGFASIPGLGDGGVEQVVGEQLGGAGAGRRVGVDHEPQQAVQLARVLAQVLQLATLHARVHRVVQAVPIQRKGSVTKKA